MRQKRFSELDVVRALSALWVIAAHFWTLKFLPFFLGFSKYQRGTGINAADIQNFGFNQFFPLAFTNLGDTGFNFLNALCGLGYQAVHIFFVLSGFGLVYSRTSKLSEPWLEFFRRRLLRLYPTFWILLTLWTLISYGLYRWFGGWIQTEELMPSTFSISWLGFLLLNDGVPFSWFMFPILQFYFAFPFLFKLLKRYSAIHFLTITFLIKLSWTLFIIFYSYLRHDGLIGTPLCPGYVAISRLFEFSLGMAAAKVYLEKPGRLIAYLTNFRTLILAIGCEIFGVLLSCTFVRLNFLNHNIPVGFAVSDALIGFGISVITFNLSRLILKLFKKLSKVLLFISNLSYEFYLCQFIPLILVPNLFPLVVPRGNPGLAAILAILLYSLAVGIGVIASLGLQKITTLATVTVQDFSRTLGKAIK